MADTSYLERTTGGMWRVVVNIPRELRTAFGNRTKHKRSLGTHSLAEANRLKHAVIAEFHELNEAAKAGKTVDAIQKAKARRRPNLGTAMALRADLERSGDDPDQVEAIEHVIALKAEEIAGQAIGEDEDGDPIFDPDKEKAAGEFFRVAKGLETPIREPLVRFHSEGVWKARTKGDSERAISYLEHWCKAEGVSFTIEAMSRKRAGQFVSAMAEGFERPDKRRKGNAMEASPIAPRTINKYISCLSSYWAWLAKKGIVADDVNPWLRQSLPEISPKDGEKERPFTADEIKKLLTGSPRQAYLKPLMFIGALTGARIGAITALRAKDIVDDCFRFAPQKREKAARLVPIHSALAPIVDQLARGKKPDDLLFPECPPVADDDEREDSMPAVKAFGTYRKKVGVDDKIAGRRRGLVNFHSFRRWFSTEAMNNGQPEVLVEAVIGHKHNSVLASVYHGGFTKENMRACVEAVKLPEGCL